MNTGSRYLMIKTDKGIFLYESLFFSFIIMIFKYNRKQKTGGCFYGNGIGSPADHPQAGNHA